MRRHKLADYSCVNRDQIFKWMKRARRRLFGTRRNRSWPERIRTWLFVSALAVVGVPLCLMLIYRVFPPPFTPLMVIRGFESYGFDRSWVPLERISPHLQRAVIASEDAKFCFHNGFDWQAVDAAIERNQKSNRIMRGASTISMQTSKNLFLWPGRNFIRKGLEAYFTIWLEAMLPKDRILELYLNVVEWGPGIYGAEAAAQKYFGVPASRLSARQAALMATVLPSPLRWNPARPGEWTRNRAGTIEARMKSVPWSKVKGVCPG